MMTSATPHPVLRRRPGDYVAAPPVTWLGDDWNVQLNIHREANVLPGETASPTPLVPREIIRFEREGAQIAVRGYVLRRDVDVADWLRYAPVVEDKTILTEFPVERPGQQGQLELTWQQDRQTWRGRYHAVRSGERLFLLQCVAPERRFADASDDFEVAIDSFAPAVEPASPHPEPLRRVASRRPLPWHLYLPASWIVEPGDDDETSAWFMADNVDRSGAPPHSTVGKVTCAVLAASEARSPRELLDSYLAALHRGGLDVGSAEIEPEDARRPFDQSWRLLATVRRGTLSGELRCRIMHHPRIWTLVGVLGVLRDDDLAAWMQNKRVLDVASRSLRLKP